MAEQSSSNKYATHSVKSVPVEEIPYTEYRTQAKPEHFKQTSNTRLKTQIDAILQNDLSILSKHPDTPHRALLTTYNNPLILRYVRNIYQEYQLKDPLPQRYQRYEKYEEKHLPESPERLKRNQGKLKNKKKIQITKNIDVGERTIEKKGRYLQRQHLKTQYKGSNEEMRQYGSKNGQNYIQYQSENVKKQERSPPSQLNPSEYYTTPPRRKINFIYRSQKNQQPQFRTHPTHASTSPSPQHGAKGDQVQNQISIRQSHQFQSPICRASNRYFDHGQNNRQLQQNNIRAQLFQQPRPLIAFNSQRYQSVQKQLMPTLEDYREREIILSQEQPPKKKTKYNQRGQFQESNIRIEVQEEPSSDIMDENIQVSDFCIPELKVMAGHGKNEEIVEKRQQSEDKKVQMRRQDIEVRQADVSPHRFIATRPLPQIITFKYHQQSEQSIIERLPLPLHLEKTETAQISNEHEHLPQYASQPSETLVELPQEVSQSFRYCLGCEQALLQANIPAHQLKCRLFQQLLELSPLQLIQYLKKKIHYFEENIRRYSSELLQTDSEQISYHSLKMMEESNMIFDQGRLSDKYNEEYSEVLTVSRKWMSITEQISKVNWFLKVRETIKKQLKV